MRSSFRIARELPQFQNAPAFLIVAGKTDGIVYHACDGEIFQVARIHLEKPRYTDREGHSVRRGRGEIMGVGEVRAEHRKQDDERAFLRLLRQAIQHVALRHPIDLVYVFVPAYLKGMLRDALPARVRSRIARVIIGDHVEEHPLDLLARVILKRSRAPSTPEAAKLLQKGRE